MREKAQAAPQTPWSTQTFPSSMSGIHLVSERHMIVADGMNIAEAEESAIGHIASWHPAVALAVADLLDRVAWMVKLDGELAGRVGVDETLAVARAYLGEPRTEGDRP
jgi:hypothetical protein